MLFWTFAAALAQPVTQVAPADLADLGWMAGCWEHHDGATRIEERWTSPEGGILLGSGKTIRDGAPTGFEFMRVEVLDGRPTFVALPSGQPEARFPLREITSEGWVFEDLAHDFPQRVTYGRTGRHTMRAIVEGVVDGNARGFTLDYTRCPRAGATGNRPAAGRK